MDKHNTLGTALVLGAVLLGSSACADEESASDATPTPESAFLARTKGKWLYEFRIDGPGGAVFVSDRLTIGPNQHDVSADVFADEARTTKILHLEWTATMNVVARSTLPDAFDVDIRLKTATLTSFVDDPALWAAFGLDDCKLVVNQAVDVMPTSCW